MSQEPMIEKHYILIGSERYQIIFDAEKISHDILIRALFHWDTVNNTQVNKIDFMLDNLSTVPKTHVLSKALWDSDDNRIELHLNTDSGDILRTQQGMSIPKGFDFKNGKEMKLILRIPVKKGVAKNKDRKILIEEEDQEDKDGSILIGSLIAKP